MAVTLRIFPNPRVPITFSMSIQRIWKRQRRKWLMRAADVHVISFPKSGRTWLVLMMARIIEFQYGVSIDNPLKLRRYRRKVPGLPLILQHHDGGPEFLAPDDLPRDKSWYAGRKVIFLVRDPRDVTVSAYYQKTKRNINYAGTLSDYVYEAVGSIRTNIEFYNIWAENRDVPDDFLLIKYEDLHSDCHNQLRSVVEFIGLRGVTDDVISRAIEACSFDNMRKLESSNALGNPRLAPRDATDASTYKTRQGRVGSYTSELGSKEIAYMDELIDASLNEAYAFYWTARARSDAGSQ